MNTHTWKQKGNLYLWRYEPENKNYCGWHLTGDVEGLNALIELLRLLESDGLEQFRTVSLSRPGEVQYQISGCKSKPVAVPKLKVEYSPSSSSEPEVLEQDGVATVCVNQRNITQYRDGLSGLLQGQNDVQVGRGTWAMWLW